MLDNRLTKYGNIRKYLLDNLTEETCITIIHQAGIQLHFDHIPVRRVNRCGKEELRFGTTNDPKLFLIPASDVFKALKLNSYRSICGKATSSNYIEFSDKYYTLKNDKGKRFSVITPKGIILYCLCTHGNEYVKSIETQVFNYLYHSSPPSLEDTLSPIFKRYQ